MKGESMAKRHFHLAFDEKYDAKVIEKLKSEKSTTGYIRRLVTLDIFNQPENHETVGSGTIPEDFGENQ